MELGCSQWVNPQNSFRFTNSQTLKFLIDLNDHIFSHKSVTLFLNLEFKKTTLKFAIFAILSEGGPQGAPWLICQFQTNFFVCSQNSPIEKP